VCLAAPPGAASIGAGTTEMLNAGPGGANILTTPNEPFTLTGIFDSSGPNLIASLPPFVSTGWVDYAPLSVTLTVGGTTYSVATYDGSMPNGGPGFSVAIFDTTQIFGTGHYGAVSSRPLCRTGPVSSATG
jgi:hypothetical protein